MAILKQIDDLDEITSLGDSVEILVQPVGASKSYRSTVGSIRSGLARANSPTLTGNVVVPTLLTEDVGLRVANAAFADNKARSIFNQLKQVKQIISEEFNDIVSVSSLTYQATSVEATITPTRADSILILDIYINGIGLLATAAGSQNWGTINLGWGEEPHRIISDVTAYISATEQNSGVGGVSAKLILTPSHDGLSPLATRTYQIFAKCQSANSTLSFNYGAAINNGRSGIVITEMVI